MSDLMTDRLMEGKPFDEQAARALEAVLLMIVIHKNVGYYMGFGSQTFSLITEAIATRRNVPVEALRKDILEQMK